jgi:hypothetical protein
LSNRIVKINSLRGRTEGKEFDDFAKKNLFDLLLFIGVIETVRAEWNADGSCKLDIKMHVDSNLSPAARPSNLPFAWRQGQPILIFKNEE